jgi:multiple sugar transport system ATP-binding protein
MVLVSHDQEEAMSLGNRIAVLKDGGIKQIGSPQELYSHPANLCVAKTIGKPEMNLYQCILAQKNRKILAIHAYFSLDVTDCMQKAVILPKEDKVILGIRPEHVEIDDTEVKGEIPATVFIAESLGAKAIVDFKMGEETIRTLVSSDKQFEIDSNKWLRFKEDKIHIFESTSGDAII